MDLGYWTIHPPDEAPGSLFEEHPSPDYANCAVVIGRTRRICIRCSCWCWVPISDSLKPLLDSGWSFIGHDWYCPRCTPQDSDTLPSKEETLKRIERPAHLQPVSTFEGGKDGTL